jgi:ABC-2 type transport system ATP-binding protein
MNTKEKLAMIRIEDVHKSFGPVRALDGLSLEVPAGKVFGLIGPNGAGKTTTIRILAGLIRPDSGRVLLNGLGSDRAVETRRMIGALIEQPGLYGKLTLAEYLAFFSRLYDLDRRQARRRIQELSGLLDLNEKSGERLQGFSLGMKQKAALARILLHDPPILLLDEPTAGLDPLITKKVRDRLLGGNDRGKKTILVSTHNLDEATRVCDEIAIIHRGRILEKGSWEELRERHTSRGRVIVRFRALRETYGDLVRQAGRASEVTLDRNRNTMTYLAEDWAEANPGIIAGLVAAGAEIVSVEVVGTSLEQAYLKLIGEPESKGKGVPAKCSV